MSLFSIDTLAKAASKGHLDLVTRFLEEGQDPEKPDNRGLTPLQYAANKGHLDIVKILVEKAKVDVDRRKEGGFGALMYAVFANHHEVVAYLLEHGAETPCSDNEYSPIHYVIMNGKKPWAKEILELMLRSGANPNCIDKLKQTPLEHAFEMKNAGILRMLVTAGANARRLDKHGLSLLHRMAMTTDFSLKDRLAIVDDILKTGIDPNIPARDGATPMPMAAGAKGKSALEMLNLLIERGADPQARDSAGNTPLDVAMTRGCPEAQNFLKSY
jgi:ankyrin repeat protein